MVKRKYLVLAERVALTFVGAFIAVYLAAFSAGQVDAAFLKDPNLLAKAETAGIAAIVPLVSGLLGFRVGNKNSPSLVTANDVTMEEPVKKSDGFDNGYLDGDVPMESPAPLNNEG